MSKFSDLKKTKFIDQALKYSEGKSSSNTERVTFSMTLEYIDILQKLSKKDRLSRSQIIRTALLNFARLSKEDRDKFYDETLS
ncbi:MAG: CopG family transcriptional regulator [Rickettsiaceae bacterium]|nr:MAG: CopG family transcriptional regulator [Rickettsiaceae bacterium]